MTRVGLLATALIVTTSMTATVARAEKRLAVLELVNGAALSQFEVEALTDDVRGACMGLPDTVVITRENILAMLPPGTDLAKCSEASCEVEAGRMLGADLVISGGVGRFAGKLQARLKLFETEQGGLLGQETATGASLEALAGELISRASALTAPLRGGVRPPTPDGRVGGGKVQEGVRIDRGEGIVNDITDDLGFLIIESTPKGAEISINGKTSGVTPMQLELMVGRYVIVAEAGKLYHPARAEVDLTTTGAKAALELPPAFGRLEVTSEPSGAEVSLDGERVGTTPWSADRRPSGRYELRVVQASYLPHTEEVEVFDGQTTRRAVKLDANFGALVVESEPRGAAISLNGEATGKTTPHTFEALQPGVYAVKLELEGHGEAVVRGTVERLGRATARGEFVPKLGLLSVMSAYEDGTPCQGTLLVDGREVGTTPGKVDVLATAHTVEVRCPKGTVSAQVTLQHNERKSSSLVVRTGGIEWVRIAGGAYRMGSADGSDDERPVHEVEVGTFEMARTETTVEQYGACVKAGACTAPRSSNKYDNWGKAGRERHPVNTVTWDHAVAFCRWAGGRLPTEAEWEYAARGRGRPVTYPWGEEKATCDRAVMNGGGYGCGEDRTWPVCSKERGNTPEGLCDMAGNVWEWVSDWYDKGYYASSPRRSPSGPSRGSGRVLRGGSFGSYAAGLRVSYRNVYSPGVASVVLGFRCARSNP